MDAVLNAIRKLYTPTVQILNQSSIHIPIVNILCSVLKKNILNLLGFQICLSTFDVVKRKCKSLQDDILWNYLQTLHKLLPNIKAEFLILHPDVESDLEQLYNNNNVLSQRNLLQFESIRKQLQVAA